MTSLAAASFVEGLKTGAYLDRARVRRLAAIYVIVGLISFVAMLSTSDGFRDKMGRPLGTDFMAFYVAGSVAVDDVPAAAYDAQKLYTEHQRLLGEEKPSFWPYLYPPAFLFLAIAFAALPYLAAWLMWMGVTLGLYVGAMQKLAPGALAALVAVAFPTVLTNFLHGQNGFLIAALFAGAVVCLFGKRPIVAGILFGLIALKPQYGVLIPVALAAAGRWRAFLAAAATVGALAALPTIAFGADIWPGFFETMRAARVEVVEAGAIGFEKIQSVFAQARMLGAPVSFAYAAQGATAIALGAFVFRLWRGAAADDVKAAGLIVASLLVSPYAVDYDLVVLAPAIALLIRDGSARGFGPYEKSAFLFAAIAPVIARPIGAGLHVSLGLIAMIALMAIVWRRSGENVVRAAAGPRAALPTGAGGR